MKEGLSPLSLNPKFFDDHLKINLKANLNTREKQICGMVLKVSAYILIQHNRFMMLLLPLVDSLNTIIMVNQYNAPRNPVATLLQAKNISVVDRFFGNLEFDYKFHFLPELRAVVNLDMIILMVMVILMCLPQSINGFRTGNNTPFLRFRMKIIQVTRINKLLDAYLAYNKEFDDVNLEVTAGYSYQKFESEKILKW